VNSLDVVGWFHCSPWSNDEKGRKNKPSDKPREQLQELRSAQAAMLPTCDLRIAVFVPDASLR
jgi:hypothetical protein